MGLRIYVAAPLARAEHAARYAACLRSLGVEVTSRWHDHVAHGATDPAEQSIRERVLRSNIEDMDRSNAAVALCDDGVPRSTLVEIGWMLASGCPVLWEWPVGQLHPVFGAHALVIAWQGHALPSEAVSALSAAIERPRRPPRHVAVNGCARVISALHEVPPDPSVDEPARGDGETEATSREFDDPNGPAEHPSEPLFGGGEAA
jgi:hypothetical protein